MEKDKKAEVTTEVEDTRPEYIKKRVLVPSITAIIFLICGIFYSIHSVYYKSTDDAITFNGLCRCFCDICTYSIFAYTVCILFKNKHRQPKINLSFHNLRIV